MGKGDKRSRKGKIWKGSYGNSRKRKPSHAAFVPKVKKAPKAAPVDKDEVATEAAAPKPKKAAAPKKPKAEGAAPKKKAAPKKSEE
ncbi:MAG TPA: 30S ribosomal protein THX [Bacteroidia bacterium]|jgi:30S ribosomal protein S31|nr:30S ribosomal protein THX [Bacteroidia bacterium]